MVEDKIILGIDPGTTVLGYGLIHVQKNKLSMVNFGIIQLSKLPTHPDKLKRIFDRLGWNNQRNLNRMKWQLKHLFLGKMFNLCSSLGRAQGVAIAASLSHNIPFRRIFTQTYKTVDHREMGSASKEQVAA
jgi:crossover junction endodeoxyribonuclease RuvC